MFSKTEKELSEGSAVQEARPGSVPSHSAPGAEDSLPASEAMGKDADSSHPHPYTGTDSVSEKRIRKAEFLGCLWNPKTPPT